MCDWLDLWLVRNLRNIFVKMGKCKLSISWGYEMRIEELDADSEAHILSHCEADRSALEWSWILEEERILDRGLHGTAYATNLFQTTLFIQYLCAIKRSLSRKYPFKNLDLPSVFKSYWFEETLDIVRKEAFIPSFQKLCFSKVLLRR